MVDESPVFLTDERRAVLHNEYEGKDNTERTHKSRIRARSKKALEELAEVAQSPHIDNKNALPPEKVATLLEAAYIPTIQPENHEEYQKELFYKFRRIVQYELEQSKDE